MPRRPSVQAGPETLSTKQAAQCAAMGEVWLNDLTAKGAFRVTNPAVGRGQRRAFDAHREVPTICAVARVARDIPQLPTKTISEMANALRDVAGRHFTAYLVKVRLGRSDQDLEMERDITLTTNADHENDRAVGPLSVLLIRRETGFEAIPFGRLTELPQAPAGESGYMLNLETVWDLLCRFMLAPKQ